MKVTEPGIGTDPPYVSAYAYSELGQLLTVTMPRPGMGVGNAATVTQTRSWVYDPKSGGWHRGMRPKQLKKPGISTAAHFTLLVTTDFVATACSQMTKWR